MRRVLITAAIAATLAGMATAATEASGDTRPSDSGAEVDTIATPAEWRAEECRYQSLQDPIWTPSEERLTAECATDRWSVPGGLSMFLSVGSCESGWNRFASNGGRYLGLFQHAASAYVSRIHSYNPPSWHRGLSERWTNSRGQIVMTARMVHAVGWGPWACA